MRDDRNGNVLGLHSGANTVGLGGEGVSDGLSGGLLRLGLELVGCLLSESLASCS